MGKSSNKSVAAGLILPCPASTGGPGKRAADDGDDPDPKTRRPSPAPKARASKGRPTPSMPAELRGNGSLCHRETLSFMGSTQQRGAWRRKLNRERDARKVGAVAQGLVGSNPSGVATSEMKHGRPGGCTEVSRQALGEYLRR